MNAEPYVNLITSQHRNAPKFVAWVRFLVSLLDPDFGGETIDAYTLSQAQGDQLNTLGVLSGIGRNVLGDETPLDDTLYRRLVRAKIVRNQFSGQQGSLSDIWETVFGEDLGISVTDNQDMTMSVDLSGADYSPEMMQLLLGGYIIPKPLGVGIRYSLITLFPEIVLGSGAVLSTGGTNTLPLADTLGDFLLSLGSAAALLSGGEINIPYAANVIAGIAIRHAASLAIQSTMSIPSADGT